MAQCMRCRKTLSHNEIGAHKRLINRGAEEFLCRECLAEKFRVSPELIDEKIRQFKENGCTLFE